MKNIIKKEYKKAIKEKRQPNCPYCGKPLEVTQTHSTFINWNWDKKKGRYIKNDTDGDCDKPYCVYCEARDWDFVYGGSATEETEKLGLDF